MLFKIILSALLLSSYLPLYAASQLRTDEEVERDYHPASISLATGILKSGEDKPQYAWPVKLLSIGHTMASYQSYGFLSAAYFHHGLDIRADAGTPVYASHGGKVVNIENYVPGNSSYWEIAILDDEGFLWQYHHIEPDSIPQEIKDSFKSGNKIADGTKIGEVVYWSVVSFGERYHHIHLNVLGAGKEYLNPFAFLAPLKDNVGPKIINITLLKNGKKVSGDSVEGNYTIAAELQDWILSDVFINPPNEIRFAIDGQKFQTMWKFDKLPGGASNTEYVNKFYVPGLACGDYSCRKPVVDLGFTKSGGQVFPTSKGSHEVKIEVTDFENNRATESYHWTVN